MRIYSIYKAKNMILGTLITLIFGVLFSMYSAQTVIGITGGITACITMVIPSLYPYMVLCNFFDMSGGTYLVGRVMRWPAKLLMGKYYMFFPQFILSLIGGYPAGAIALNSLVKRGATDKETARKVLMFSVNTSPAFLVFGVGEGMLFSRDIGWILFGVNLLVSFITLIFVTRILLRKDAKPPKYEERNEKKLPIANVFIESVSTASRSVFFLCGFVVLFFALNEIFAYMPLGNITAIISAVGEVTSSCAMLSSGAGTLPMISAITAFGGVCVLFQVMVTAKEISPRWRTLLLVQFTKGVLSFLIMLGVSKAFPKIDLLRSKDVLSNMTSEGRMDISSSPVTSVCLILTAIALLHYMIATKGIKESFKNEKLGIHQEK